MYNSDTEEKLIILENENGEWGVGGGCKFLIQICKKSRSNKLRKPCSTPVIPVSIVTLRTGNTLHPRQVSLKGSESQRYVLMHIWFL
jgi:hypothetical protein